MTGSVLLIGSDSDWCEALKIDMEADGWHAVPAHKQGREALEGLMKSGERIAAAVIAAFGNRSSDGAEAAIRAAEVLRGISPGLPLLFDISVPDYAVTAFTLRAPPARIVSKERSDSIAAILRKLCTPAAPARRQSPRFAAFEIRCDVASVTFAARLDSDGDTVGPFPVPWSQDRRLKEINDQYRQFRLFKRDQELGRRLTPDWSATLKDTGSQLCTAIGLDEGAQAAVLAAYVGKLGHLKHVHFRFNLPHDGMVHIPFELVWDSNRATHLRELAPIARRLLLDDRQVVGTAQARPAGAELRGSVLFILSPAHGSLSVKGLRFGEADTFDAQELRYINEELGQLKRARQKAGLGAPTELLLSPEDGQVDLVLDTLAEERWDIVHFAGHSVCADNGEVFLLLPGAEGPVALRVQDFAHAAQEGGARLVVLSSCEGTSPDAVFRLAQAGVPAAIGFRWEVDDKEAAEFTLHLHQALARGEAVGRAFHRAVSRLKAIHVDSPTFASPVLMVQDEDWAEPTVSGRRSVKDVADRESLGPA